MAEKYATQKDIDRIERRLEGFCILILGLLLLYQFLPNKASDFWLWIGALSMIAGFVTLIKYRPATNWYTDMAGLNSSQQILIVAVAALVAILMSFILPPDYSSAWVGIYIAVLWLASSYAKKHSSRKGKK